MCYLIAEYSTVYNNTKHKSCQCWDCVHSHNPSFHPNVFKRDASTASQHDHASPCQHSALHCRKIINVIFFHFQSSRAQTSYRWGQLQPEGRTDRGHAARETRAGSPEKHLRCSKSFERVHQIRMSRCVVSVRMVLIIKGLDHFLNKAFSLNTHLTIVRTR